ncbi:MAG TPA: hypothetical protein VFS26_03220 [Solirubrobacterales bacterium]|nr:hypothetical protein [Solirubrobacterales bacterium]
MAGCKQSRKGGLPMNFKRYALAGLAVVAALVTALTLVLNAAAEAPKISVTNTGGLPDSGTTKCTYTLKTEICQLTVTNESTFDVKIITAEITGIEAKNRYSISSGCVVGAKLESGKTCTDEVKLIADGSTLWSNNYFIEVQDANSNEKMAANASLTVK